MKKYIIPALKVEEAQAAQMLAESLNISDDPVDGGDALTKKIITFFRIHQTN